MNKEKIITFLKTKVGIGIICFLVGVVISSGFAKTKDKEIYNKQQQISNLQNELEKSKTNLNDTATKLKTSEDKVAQAKPFFDMKDEEQKQLQAKTDKDKADRQAQEKANQDKIQAETKAKADADAKARLEAKTKTLSNGNFTAGTDFDSGTYTITAVSGGGNVSSSNMYSGGLNAVMGVKDDSFYQKEYKNIELPSGTTLKISGVTVKLTPVE